MTAFGAAYRASRFRLTELVAALDGDALARTVPACPGWTLGDLVRHVTGVAADLVRGNVAAAGQEDWTRAQIEARRALPLTDVLAEWERAAEQVEPSLDALHPFAAALMVSDLVTHEHDARGALGDSGARDSDAVVIGFETYARTFGRRVKERGLPTVELRAGELRALAGKEEPAVNVVGELFELFRALGGRRTKDEIAALAWSGDPAPYLDIFSVFGTPAASLGE